MIHVQILDRDGGFICDREFPAVPREGDEVVIGVTGPARVLSVTWLWEPQGVSAAVCIDWVCVDPSDVEVGP